LFLPVHFLALGAAIRDDAGLEGMLRWADQPLIKAAEVVLVLLFAAHMTGGVRLLMLEFLPWRAWQKTLLALAAGTSLVFALAFLLNLV